MTAERDDDLRARFATMRRVESERAPSFRNLAASPPRTRTRGSRVRIAFALAVVAAVAVVAHRATRDAERPSAVSLAHWTAPTDFLLRTPGVELVSSSPALLPVPSERIRLP